MLTEFNLGDKVQMRKNHACGANEWEITRCGADIKLRCTHCGRVIMLDRMDFMRSAKRITARAASSDADGAGTAVNLPDSRQQSASPIEVRTNTAARLSELE